MNKKKINELAKKSGVSPKQLKRWQKKYKKDDMIKKWDSGEGIGEG